MGGKRKQKGYKTIRRLGGIEGNEKEKFINYPFAPTTGLFFLRKGINVKVWILSKNMFFILMFLDVKIMFQTLKSLKFSPFNQWFIIHI